MSDNHLPVQIRVLEGAALIERAPELVELGYRFRHALIRDAAYDSLLRANRRALHQVVADTLERLYRDRLDVVAATLAYHFDSAGSASKAFDYYLRAAKRAQAVFANAEALSNYRAAIRLYEYLSPAFRDDASPVKLARLYEDSGDLQELTGELGDAVKSLETAISILPASVGLTRARLYRKIGTAQTKQLAHAEAMRGFEQAEESLGPQPAQHNRDWWYEWLRIQLERVVMYYWRGMETEVTRLVDRVKPVIGEYGTPELRFYFYDGLISQAERRERYHISDETLSNSYAMLAAAEESRIPRHIAMARFQLGFGLLWYGDLEKAERELLRGEQLLAQVGDATWLTHTLTYTATLYRLCGNLEKARIYSARSIDAAKLHGIAIAVTRCTAHFAWLAWRAGDFEEAMELGLRAIEGWTRISFSDPFQWWGSLPLLAVAQSRGQAAEAIQYASAMLRPTQHRLPETLNAALEESVQAFERDDLAQVKLKLAEVVSIAQRLSYL